MFVLKKWQLNYENINESYIELIRKMSEISELEKLLKPDISDTEFLEIIGEFYTYNKEHLEEDIKDNLGVLFSHVKVQSGSISTDFSFFGLKNLKLMVYTTDNNIIKSAIYLNKRYSLIELEELICARKLLISKVLNEKNHSLFYNDRQALGESYLSLALNKITLARLGVYETWFLPLIKESYTHKKVRGDILSLIVELKEELAKLLELLKSRDNYDPLALSKIRKMDSYLNLKAKTLGR